MTLGATQVYVSGYTLFTAHNIFPASGYSSLFLKSTTHRKAITVYSAPLGAFCAFCVFLDAQT